MTEVEWLACKDTKLMFEFLRGKASVRKLRLFAVACCRRIWHLLDDLRCRHAVEVAEKYADGLATKEELRDAAIEANEARKGFGSRPETIENAPWAASLANQAFRGNAWLYFVLGSTGTDQHFLFQDILGNLFRPETPDTVWLTWNNGTVVKIAEAIYADKAFDQMPILADALEDADCHNTDILNHCRLPGIHVRGCWVVDLLLGKE